MASKAGDIQKLFRPAFTIHYYKHNKLLPLLVSRARVCVVLVFVLMFGRFFSRLLLFFSSLLIAFVARPVNRFAYLFGCFFFALFHLIQLNVFIYYIPFDVSIDVNRIFRSFISFVSGTLYKWTCASLAVCMCVSVSVSNAPQHWSCKCLTIG